MSGIDRISELPEFLQTQILSYLPTKDSVKTSALSKKWKNVWLHVPVLDLDCDDFPDYFPWEIPLDVEEGEDEVDYEPLHSFLDRFLGFNPESRSRLLKVKVKCSSAVIEGLEDRIGAAISLGPQHLDVVSSTEYLDDDTHPFPCVDFIPLNLYTSKTLVSLKLTSSGLSDTDFVFLPCLKFMTLVQVKWRVHLEKLVSGCPLLEELTLVRDLGDDYALTYDEFSVMRVRSQSLKRFHVPLRYGSSGRSRVKCTLEVDAPGLEHMSLGVDHFDSIVVKNLTSLFSIDLGIKFVVKFGVFFDPVDLPKRNEIRDFLTGISSASHMIISPTTVKALEIYSKVGVIPEFSNLSRLQAVFRTHMLPFLPAFLECCPNLKHLVLEVDYARRMVNDVLELTNVPRCFLSTLECVEVKITHEWEEEEKKVASYFLENAAVLKKFTLSLTDYPRHASDSEIYEEVNKVTKRSPGCRIVLDS